jgi:hypothetical protein
MYLSFYCVKVVYILDQVRALENEMLLRIRKQGLDVTPRILIVSVFMLLALVSGLSLYHFLLCWVLCDVILFFTGSPR